MKITLSGLVYWLAKICFILSILILIYIISGLLIYMYEEISNIKTNLIDRMHHEGKEMVHLKLPFTKFAVGFPTKSLSPIFMVLVFGFYSFYFFLMQKFFAIFNTNTSFTEENLNASKKFLQINIVPIVFWMAMIIYSIFNTHEIHFSENFIFILIHIFITLLIYLYQDILKKGLLLKEENDLTI